MTIVFMILLAIFVIVFFVFVWKSADTWRWYQLLLTSVVMLLALIFLFPLAGVFKSRMAWNKMQTDLENQLERARAENELLREGDISNPNVGEGLLELQHQLQKLGSEAGRVWRSLQMQDVTPQGIRLAAAAPAADDDVLPDTGADDDNGAAAASTVSLSGLDQGMIVYGFAESQTQGQEMLLPTFYLGEFRVTAREGNALTLEATGNLSQGQLQAINTNNARFWSLYEMLPLDGHEPFVAEGSIPTDDALFGRMDEELIDRLLGGKVMPETLVAYKRDGSRAVANDPPETRWVKIEFTKSYDEIDVDSTDQRGALDGGFFDSVGRAVDSRLQRNEEGKLVFAPGDQLVLQEEAAQELIQKDVAKPIDTYFVRPLNDYRFVLRRLRARIAEMEHRRGDLEYQIEVIKEAVQHTEDMLVANQQDKLKLEKDAAQFATERKAADAYRQMLADDLAETRKQLIAVYRSNLALTEQLTDAHQQLEADINARTEAATQ